MPDFTALIEYIQQSNLPQKDKEAIIAIAKDETISAEDKGKKLADFIDAKFAELDKAQADIVGGVLDDGQKKMEGLQQDLDNSLAALDEEVTEA